MAIDDVRRRGEAPLFVQLPDVLDVEQAAQYLGISKLSMYKLIRDKDKRVPVKSIAGAFKISKRQLLEWFETL